MKNDQTKSNLVFNSLRSSAKRDWYFNSWSSHHMIDEWNFLFDLKPVNVGKVTFKDSVVGKIIWKGKLNNQIYLH